jgi:hypothetical protein
MTHPFVPQSGSLMCVCGDPLSKHHDAVAQRTERRPTEPGVAGSTPASVTSLDGEARHDCTSVLPAVWTVQDGEVWKCTCGRIWIARQDDHGGYMPRGLANEWRRETRWRRYRRTRATS